MSGYNSDWGLHVWKQWLEPTTADGPKTQLVTLWLGANDAVLPNELQAVPLDRFKANLRAIVALVHERCPEASVVLITPTPFHPEGWLDERVRRGLTREHDRARERTSEYAEAVRQLGRELNLPVADAYTPVDAEMRQLGPEKEGTVFTDGLHLNSGAYKHVVNGASSASLLSLATCRCSGAGSRATVFQSLTLTGPLLRCSRRQGDRVALPGQGARRAPPPLPLLEGHPCVMLSASQCLFELMLTSGTLLLSVRAATAGGASPSR